MRWASFASVPTGCYFVVRFRRTRRSEASQDVVGRLEIRDSYDVTAERGQLARYLAGEPGPDPDRKSPWLDELRADTAAGKRWQWVHVVRGPLSPYLRMAFEWGYSANVRAGADVRILDLAEHPWPDGLVDEEFWLLDDHAVLIMRYDDQGRYLGAEPAGPGELGRYRRARDAAWQAAVPLSLYWREHPQYHRAA
jgi:hypothetical protein